MTAPAPSPYEQSEIDRFGIFAEERVVEEVARAIDEARDAHGPFYFPCKCGWEAGFGAGWEDRGDRHRLLSLAAAAIAAYRAAQDGGAEEAVRRVEALAETWRYKGEFGWGQWQAGEGPDIEGQILDDCALALRAVLRPAVVGDEIPEEIADAFAPFVQRIIDQRVADLLMAAGKSLRSVGEFSAADRVDALAAIAGPR